MRPFEGQLLAVPRPATQRPMDSTSTAAPRFMHHHYVWPRIVGGVIWLAVMIYVLWLATRVVRAVEKVADKFEGRAR